MVKSLPAMWEPRVPSLGWENPMDGGVWRATVYGTTKSWTGPKQLTLSFFCLEGSLACILWGLGWTCKSLKVFLDEAHSPVWWKALICGLPFTWVSKNSLTGDSPIWHDFQTWMLEPHGWGGVVKQTGCWPLPSLPRSCRYCGDGLPTWDPRIPANYTHCGLVTKLCPILLQHHGL